MLQVSLSFARITLAPMRRGAGQIVDNARAAVIRAFGHLTFPVFVMTDATP